MKQKKKQFSAEISRLEDLIAQKDTKINLFRAYIKSHRLELVRLRERNDALQSALVGFVYQARELQKTNPEFLARYNIMEDIEK